MRACWAQDQVQPLEQGELGQCQPVWVFPLWRGSSRASFLSSCYIWDLLRQDEVLEEVCFGLPLTSLSCLISPSHQHWSFYGLWKLWTGGERWGHTQGVHGGPLTHSLMHLKIHHCPARGSIFFSSVLHETLPSMLMLERFPWRSCHFCVWKPLVIKFRPLSFLTSARWFLFPGVLGSCYRSIKKTLLSICLRYFYILQSIRLFCWFWTTPSACCLPWWVIWLHSVFWWYPPLFTIMAHCYLLSSSHL